MPSQLLAFWVSCAAFTQSETNLALFGGAGGLWARGDGHRLGVVVVRRASLGAAPTPGGGHPLGDVVLPGGAGGVGDGHRQVSETIETGRSHNTHNGFIRCAKKVVVPPQGLWVGTQKSPKPMPDREL